MGGGSVVKGIFKDLVERTSWVSGLVKHLCTNGIIPATIPDIWFKIRENIAIETDNPFMPARIGPILSDPSSLNNKKLAR